MIALLLSILCSTSIYITFKLAEKLNIDNFRIILINYFIATILGFTILFLENGQITIETGPWLLFSVIIGSMFIMMFFLIGYSSQKAGISVTSVATRMSVLIPIVFSMIIDESDRLTITKLIAIAVALVALVLTIYKPGQARINWKYLFLPVILFLGAGLVDSFVKYAQHNYVDADNLSVFSSFVFLVSLILTSLVGLFGKKNKLKDLKSGKAWGIGIILGMVNFGSMYFIIKTLDSGIFDGSIVFALNNIGIVVLSVLLAIVLFQEKLSSINKAGIVLSVIALWLLTNDSFLKSIF
jgi:drug/metabolite transporter (DMT)-like permease